MPQWQINLTDIPSEGLPLEGGVQLVQNRFDPTFVSRVHDAEAKAILRKISGGFTLDGSFSLVVDFVCSRCVEAFSKELVIPFRLRLTNSWDDDPGTFTYRGETLIFEEVVEELALLHIPMKPLCSEECKGICTSCGVSRNSESCGCSQIPEDLRFSVLKNIKKEL